MAGLKHSKPQRILYSRTITWIKNFADMSLVDNGFWSNLAARSWTRRRLMHLLGTD